MKHVTFSRIGRAALVAAAICVATVPSPSFAETYTWAGASGADWATETSWSPSGTPTSADTIRFESATAVSVGGSTTLPVAQIVNAGAGDVTFDCPVQFAGTYFVEKNGAVR